MMAPAAARDDPDGHSLDRQIERHIGCMAGFLQLFDRPQILAGKRIYAAKRVPYSPAAGSTSPSERSDASFSSSSFKPCPSPEESPSSPESTSSGMADVPRGPQPLPLFDFKDGMRSSWKMREAPRLSLDSRAVVDGKGKLRPREVRTSGGRPNAAEDLDKQRRSPSVVARLMGLDALPGVVEDPASRAELRRSASESRVSRDLSNFRFVDPSFFQKHAPPLEFSPDLKAELRARDFKTFPEQPRTPAGVSHHLQRKSFFDAQDFYPEPKRTGSLYGEIERRLRMRGIDEPARDLETLKQVLEVLQLKGLLHEQRQQQANGLRRGGDSPPIVLMKPSPRPPRRPVIEPPSLPSRPARGNLGLETASATGRTRRTEADRNPRGRSPRSPDRNEIARSPSSPARRRQVNSLPAPPPPRRTTTSNSPRTCPRRAGPEPAAIRPPRNRRSKANITSPTVDDDASTTVSGSSFSNSSLDFERLTTEDYRSGRSLLERCDKLLHSIAAITSSPAGGGAVTEIITAAEQQPSPVSVLDSSSFLGDESSPSPITPRSIDFKDQPSKLEEDAWIMADQDGNVAEDEGQDGDYVYVAEIIRVASDRRDLSDVYAILEKRYQKKADVAETALLHRRMLFDAVAEILDRQRSVLPWDAFHLRSGGGAVELRGVWAEVRRAGERVETAADYLNSLACGAMRKDMVAAGERGGGMLARRRCRRWCSTLRGRYSRTWSARRYGTSPTSTEARAGRGGSWCFETPSVVWILTMFYCKINI